MEIKLYSLKLKNFKGIKELEINFNCQDTNIYGANATGKTTVFDAFKWLFFDKDSNDRKDFNIKTLDKNNKPIHYLEHEVEAILVIDGIDMTFRKMLKEKWVKKRGETKQEFSGHETSYCIDDVPVKKKDYEEKINSLIPESLFKLITDPLYFNNQLKWQDRRELLVNLSGEAVSDEDILNEKKFTILKDNLNGRSIEDYKKVVLAKIKELNKQKETIPVRIDELTNTLVTEHDIDYEKVELEKTVYQDKLKLVEKQMIDVQARAESNMKLADQLGTLKRNIENFRIEKEREYSQKYVSELIKLESDKKIIENRITICKNDFNDISAQIKKDNDRKKELYKMWDEVSKSKLEIDPNSFICPTCKREYDVDKKQEMESKFESNFKEHIKAKQQEINVEGQSLNVRINENQNKLVDIQNETDEKQKEYESIVTKIKEIEKQKDSEGKFDISNVPKYNEKLQEINELENRVNSIENEDTSAIQAEEQSILDEINKLDKILNDKAVQEKTNNRIKELASEEEKIAKQIQEFESLQYSIEEFTKTKVELLENAINSKFDVVNFRLFSTQINGGLVECCDTLVNGVPYSDVNNAHKILAGLDIINTLTKFYNTSAPIFIDNRESINEIYSMNTQIINLIVTNDKELRIEVK